MNARVFTGLVAGALLATAAAQGVADPLPFGAESRLWFTGASNLRRFTCHATELGGALELPASASVAGCCVANPRLMARR